MTAKTSQEMKDAIALIFPTDGSRGVTPYRAAKLMGLSASSISRSVLYRKKKEEQNAKV